MARPEVTGKKTGPDRSNDRIINTKQFCRILDGIHPHTLMRRMEKDPRFPPPIPNIRLNGHHWWESDAIKYRDATCDQMA